MRAETKELYPDNWQEISRACIKRSKHTCQDCGRSDQSSLIVLTTHHKDYDPSNNDSENLVCLCQGCHLRRQATDLQQAIEYHKLVLLIRMGQLCLPGLELRKSKVPARVLEGKALATRAKRGRYAQRDIWQ